MVVAKEELDLLLSHSGLSIYVNCTYIDFCSVCRSLIFGIAIYIHCGAQPDAFLCMHFNTLQCTFTNAYVHSI